VDESTVSSTDGHRRVVDKVTQIPVPHTVRYRQYDLLYCKVIDETSDI